MKRTEATVGGAGTRDQCRPPSVVLRSRSPGQVPRWQVAGTASIQPVDASRKLAEMGLRAGPAAPPARWAVAVPQAASSAASADGSAAAVKNVRIPVIPVAFLRGCTVHPLGDESPGTPNDD